MPKKSLLLVTATFLLSLSLFIFFYYRNKPSLELYLSEKKFETGGLLYACVNTKTDQARQECIYQQGISKKSTPICLELSLEAKRNECLESVKFLLMSEDGVDEKEVEICKSFDFKKKACFEIFASKITEKESCYQLPEEFQERCLNDLISRNAYREMDESKCSGINDKDATERCKDNIVNNMEFRKDTDKDGLLDESELRLSTNPFEFDTDNDQLGDGDEINKYFSNPLKIDSDDDGVSDKNESILSTNPQNTDTDGDGFSDGDEIAKSFNPCGDGVLPEKEELQIICQKFLLKKSFFR
jgi:hypothetical protein